VGAERGDLPVERVGDIDVMVWRRVRHHPHLGHLPGLEALVGEQLGKGERVAGVRIDRAKRGLARREVVRVRGLDARPVAFR
jgi:hypothetical protein